MHAFHASDPSLIFSISYSPTYPIKYPRLPEISLNVEPGALLNGTKTHKRNPKLIK